MDGSFIKKIHFMGKKTYSKKRGEKEMLELGVSRRMPQHVIRNQIKDWGTEIGLGFWTFTRKENIKNVLTRLGTAEVIGYFRVRGLNFDKEILEKIKDKLDVVDERDYGGKRIERECGGYNMGGGCTVANSLLEVMDLIAEVDPKAKVSVCGKYTPIKPHIFLKDVKFSRTLLNTELSQVKIGKESGDIENELQGINNYKQTTYYTKEELAKRESGK